MGILIRNALIYAGPGSGAERGDILIEGDRIVAAGGICTGEPAGARAIDGTGHLAIPGLINAHFHSSVNHMRGMLDGLPLEIFMLYESPALDALRPTPREAYVRTALGAMEMLRCGVTSVQDDAFFVPHPTPEIVDAVMQAYADTGIRARVALDQPNVAEIDKLPFLADLLPADLKARASLAPAFGAPELLAVYGHLFARWHGACGGRLKASVSCSAPQRVTVDYFKALDALSRRHAAPFYVHMLETKTQRVLGERRYGHSLVRHVSELGLLSDRLNLIHCVWVDAADLDLIAASGAVVAHNPVCNLRLGSGVMPFRAMRERGIAVCLGTDEIAADDSANLWSAIKTAGLIHTLSDADYERWPKAREILDCTFAGGARAMHAAGEIGEIAAGRQADIVLLDLDSAAFTPLNDIERQLVYSETGASVAMTMVAGQIVLDDGRIATVDERALRAEARGMFAARREGIALARQEASAWLPAYRRMYLQAMQEDTGMHRRLDGLA
jgi:cytosine/adenosine deaminase-related metal-dependent hydrolase